MDYGLPPGAQPLPDMLFGHSHPFYPSPVAVQGVTVTNNGNGGAPSLTLTTAATETRVIPYGSTTFDMSLAANFAGDVILSVLAPDGWYVRFDDANTGAGYSVAVFPAPEAAPGSYTLDVVAQSKSLPSVYTATQQTVEVTAVAALTMQVTADSRTTIPMGNSALDTVSGQTNDGEAEIPNSAFIVGLFNSANAAKAITLTVTGAPAGWIVLNGARQSSATLTLGAIEQTLVGLYVIPPTLPARGYTLQG